MCSGPGSGTMEEQPLARLTAAPVRTGAAPPRRWGTVAHEFETTLTAAQAGADWAVTVLYRRNHPSLLRYLRSQTGQDADDVGSQVWLEVARGLNRFEGDEAAFRRWVFTLAYRRIADQRRSFRRRRAVPVVDAVLNGHAGTDDPAAEVEQADAGADAARRVAAALPPDMANIVLLRVVAGLSVEEVAEITGRKPGTVRVMQHRGLKRLAEVFEDHDLEV
jgi:RNA polymerase sigma-70 factor, ECF subfamily